MSKLAHTAFVTAAALLLPVPPSTAASESGILVEIEAWSSTPQAIDTDYAFIDDSSSLSGGGTVQTLDYGDEVRPRLRAGWRFAGASDPVLGMTVWEHTAQGQAATAELPGQVGPLLASPDFQSGGFGYPNFVDSATANGRLQATVADVDFSWAPVNDGSARVRVGAGVRYFRFERELNVVYRAQSGGEYVELVKAGSESRGVGPRLDVAFGYRFGGRMAFVGGLGAAMVVGEVDGTALDQLFLDDSFLVATSVERAGTSEVFPQLQAQVRLEVDLVGELAASIGYRLEYWDGVATDLRFVDVVGQNAALPVESDVVYEGWTLGLRYEF